MIIRIACIVAAGVLFGAVVHVLTNNRNATSLTFLGVFMLGIALIPE